MHHCIEIDSAFSFIFTKQKEIITLLIEKVSGTKQDDAIPGTVVNLDTSGFGIICWPSTKANSRFIQILHIKEVLKPTVFFYIKKTVARILTNLDY